VNRNRYASRRGPYHGASAFCFAGSQKSASVRSGRGGGKIEADILMSIMMRALIFGPSKTLFQRTALLALVLYFVCLKSKMAPEL
jgi:hypothetical protein